MIQPSGQKESRSPVGAGKAASEKILQSEYSASGAKSQAWRQAEHAADARTAKELAPLMLWAMTEREPVVMRDPLDHYDLRYSHIEAVYFRPTEPALTVRLRDVAADSITRPNARDVSLLRDEPDELPDVWQRINLTTERKEEIFEAMRRAYVVTHAGTEYRRISAMIFERNMHGRASVLLEVVDCEDSMKRQVFPQATVGISNHLLTDKKGENTMIHTTEMIEYIPVTDLYPHPDNPRKDLGDLAELADSIRQNGVMQNLTVTPRESGGYTVVIGHRRLAAAKLAGRSTVPCAVTDMDAKTQLRTMMMENMQRSDLTGYEQAQGFQRMLDMGDSIKDVSESTGFSEATIRRRTKLLELDQEKFAAAQKRGATLADYAELDKVSDPIRKNKLLDVIGTENFRFKLKAAVDEEKREKNRARIISQLNEFAKPYQGSSPYSDGDIVKYYYLQAGNEKVSRPGDAETREYFYTTNSDYSVGLFAKKSDEYLKERDERVLQEKKEQSEREKRVMGLKDVSNCARELRQEFVETVGVRAIRANMKKIVAALVFCAFDRYVELPIEPDGMKFFGISGRDVTREAVAQAVSAPERPLLKLAYSALECDFGEGYHGWDGQYEGNNDLDMLYDLLQSLGYQMSDEEKALQDGSHELFKREEE